MTFPETGPHSCLKGASTTFIFSPSHLVCLSMPAAHGRHTEEKEMKLGIKWSSRHSYQNLEVSRFHWKDSKCAEAAARNPFLFSSLHRCSAAMAGLHPPYQVLDLKDYQHGKQGPCLASVGLARIVFLVAVTWAMLRVASSLRAEGCCQ